jgi:hypothetical protein
MIQTIAASRLRQFNLEKNRAFFGVGEMAIAGQLFLHLSTNWTQITA